MSAQASRHGKRKWVGGGCFISSSETKPRCENCIVFFLFALFLCWWSIDVMRDYPALCLSTAGSFTSTSTCHNNLQLCLGITSDCVRVSLCVCLCMCVCVQLIDTTGRHHSTTCIFLFSFQLENVSLSVCLCVAVWWTSDLSRVYPACCPVRSAPAPVLP